MFSTWMWMAVVAGGIAALGAGLWWELADLALDHLGSPLIDWPSRPHDDENVLSGGAAAAR